MAINSPVPLLLNPKAGSLFRSGLKDWLREHESDFRFIETKSAKDLTAKARALADHPTMEALLARVNKAPLF